MATFSMWLVKPAGWSFAYFWAMLWWRETPEIFAVYFLVKERKKDGDNLDEQTSVLIERIYIFLGQVRDDVSSSGQAELKILYTRLAYVYGSSWITKFLRSLIPAPNSCPLHMKPTYSAIYFGSESEWCTKSAWYLTLNLTLTPDRIWRAR